MIYHKFLSIIIVVSIISILLAVPGCKQSSSNIPWNEVKIDTQAVNELQTEVDNGHEVGELDPVQVAYDFLTSKLGIEGKLVTGHKEFKAGQGEKGYKVTLSDRRVIEIILFQPVKKGPSGIWVVKKYRFLNK